MAKQTALVTGGSAGIGLETVKGLARAGLSVVFTGRDENKGRAAAETVRRETGNSDVTFAVLDLLEPRKIQSFVREVLGGSVLNVLVNNAGGLYPQLTLTPEGVEATLAANHLGHFLLTSLLEDRLASGARIVNVASSAHTMGSAVWENPRGRYNSFAAYSRAKLANVLFTGALSRRLRGRAEVNAVHPGVVRTEFSRPGQGAIGFLTGVAQSLMGISPAQGARTSLFLALSPEAAGQTGKYYAGSRPRLPSATARDERAQDELWAFSARWVSSLT